MKYLKQVQGNSENYHLLFETRFKSQNGLIIILNCNWMNKIIAKIWHPSITSSQWMNELIEQKTFELFVKTMFNNSKPMFKNGR